MRELPLADPGVPDLRSPARFLLWVARRQAGTIAIGALYGVLWAGAMAITPALVGHAIDGGVAAGDTAALLRWSGLVLAVGIGGAAAGIMRHRTVVVNWLAAVYRVQQLLVRHAVRLGGSLPRRIAAGEVVSVGSHDVERIGGAIDVSARLAGAIASFFVVAVLMLRASTSGRRAVASWSAS